jgi:hypothetical protein
VGVDDAAFALMVLLRFYELAWMANSGLNIWELFSASRPVGSSAIRKGDKIAFFEHPVGDFSGSWQSWLASKTMLLTDWQSQGPCVESRPMASGSVVRKARP